MYGKCRSTVGEPPKNTNPPTKSISILQINEGNQALKLDQLITQSFGIRTKGINSSIKGVVQSELYHIMKNDPKINELYDNNTKGADFQKTLELPANGTLTKSTLNQLESIYGQYNQNTKYYKNPITYANPCAYATANPEEYYELWEEYGPKLWEVIKEGALGLGALIALSPDQSNKKTHEGTKGVDNINDAKKNPKGADKSKETPKIKYPGNDPTKSPGKDWQWKGKGEQGSGQGNYTNPKTGESLHPDLGHSTEGKGIGPHWDYKSPEGKWYRIFPDGTIQPK